MNNSPSHDTQEEKNPSPLSWNSYQKQALSTAIYQDSTQKLFLASLGLAGETGEVCEKIKKLCRDHKGIPDDHFKKALTLELGDVLWYLSVLADHFDIPLENIAKDNLAKLKNRQAKGTIQGQGDWR